MPFAPTVFLIICSLGCGDDLTRHLHGPRSAGGFKQSCHLLGSVCLLNNALILKQQSRFQIGGTGLRRPEDEGEPDMLGVFGVTGGEVHTSGLYVLIFSVW